MRALRFGLALVLALALLAGLARPAAAHAMRTAYVEIVESAGGRVSVRVKSGATWGGIHVVMPEGCSPPTPESPSWTCTRPLAGSEIGIEGLGGVVGDAAVVVTLEGGATASQLLRPGASRWTVPAEPTPLAALGRYARAGFFHVLAGADHLLFLAALVVALRRFRAVLLAETAFTVSHSIAFSASALGWIHVPPAAAEAAIALSLVLVAIDVGKRPMRAAAGARAAFVFGAVHGLGFAGGLAEMGVPRGAALPALVGFAGGVEAAQVVFLLGFFALHALAARLSMARRLGVLTAYAVGVTGAFWLVDRVVPLVTGSAT